MAETKTIEATGRSVVRAQAEVAVLQLGVSTEAKKPAEAVQANAGRMTKVIEAIKAMKIPESAIQTAGLSLQPIYKWDEGGLTPHLLGYVAHNSVTVHTPVDVAGAVYDAGVVAGANTAGGIAFTVTDDRKYRGEALAQATKVAVEEIHAVAKALGASLIGPIQAQVIAEQQPETYELALDKASAAETPVMPGRVEIGARVRVVYAIQ